MIDYPDRILPLESPGQRKVGQWSRSEIVTTAVLVMLVLGMAGSMWLNWFTFFGSEGNSFRLLDVLDLVGLEELRPFRVVWFLLPVLEMCVMVLLALRKFFVASGLQIVISLVVLVFAGVVVHYTNEGIGALMAACLGFCSIVCSLALMYNARSKKPVSGGI